MRLYGFLGLLFCICCVGVAAEEQEIIVNLETEESLIPVHLKAFRKGNTTFTNDYILQLEAILRFDLNHNGESYLVENSSPSHHVVEVSLSDQSLSADVAMPRLNQFKSVDHIPLTGQLSEDRRQIHKLADALQRTMFRSDGIASTKILYTLKVAVPGGRTKEWKSEVWQIDYDGGNAHPITHNTGFCVTPCYVPSKPRFLPGSFLYVGYKTGQSKIYIASLHEGEGSRLMMLQGNQLMPAISRQRDKIAFISDVTGNPDLFLQRFSPEEGVIGKPQQIFTAGKSTQGTPTFSPDGKQIAFVTNKDGTPRIYVMGIPSPHARLKDIKTTLISRRNRENTAPTWSPDGTKLAYCSMTEGVRQIWVYDFTSGMEKQLTQGPHNKENPSWAPNSLHLVYNTTGGSGSELYLVNMKQPKSEKITTGQGEKHYPDWEPRAKDIPLPVQNLIFGKEKASAIGRSQVTQY